MKTKHRAGYADGFVIAVPKGKIAAYRRIAVKAGRIWREHGAIDYKECVGDDLNVKCGPGFLKGVRTRPGETIVFSWITYRSRAHRDRVNAKVMKDSRISEICDPGDMPFDVKRMLYGGFKIIVDA